MRNELIPFLLRHCAAGIAAGWLSLALLLWADVGWVGTLVAASDLWPLPLLMLLAGFAVTFGSAAMGAAIMGLGRDAPGHRRAHAVRRPHGGRGPPGGGPAAPARRTGGAFNGG